jgi:toxin YoeB
VIVAFAPTAWDDFCDWITTDTKTTTRILSLIAEIRRTPFDGTGKHEPLKQNLKGFWSRRIDGENRLVYRVDGKGAEQRVQIAMVRYHYK